MNVITNIELGIRNSLVSMFWNTALTKHCDVIIFLLYGLQNNGVYFRPDSLLSYNDTPPLRISRLHTNNEACKPFFDIGCCCVWSYPYVASFYVSYSSNGNTSFQKQQSSVHFPLQINKFVIVRFTLVFHSILSNSLSLSLDTFSHIILRISTVVSQNIPIYVLFVATFSHTLW